jgi:hypothetical protein
MDTSFSPAGGFGAGCWKHVGAGIRLFQKRPVTLCHSGGNAAQDREADLRRRVGRIASTFLDGRTWHEVLDFEQGRKAFFYGRPQRLPASRTWARMALRANCLNRPKDRPRRCRRNQFSLLYKFKFDLRRSYNYLPCGPFSFRLGLVLSLPTPTGSIHATEISIRLLCLSSPL